MYSISKTLLTLLALSTSAFASTEPTEFDPSSNPTFTPALGQLVPVGKPFNITWDPTSKGTITIVLLKGPSTNVVPLYPIAEEIPNKGFYLWTPKTDLAPGKTGYGLQLIQDATGAYQYSVQFGISNPDYEPSKSTSKTTSDDESTTSSYTTVRYTTQSSVTSFLTLTTSSKAEEETTSYAPTYAPSTYAPPAPTYANTTTTRIAPSGAPPTSTTIPAPSASATGSASGLKVASGLLLGVAGVVAILL